MRYLDLPSDMQSEALACLCATFPAFSFKVIKMRLESLNPLLSFETDYYDGPTVVFQNQAEYSRFIRSGVRA